MYNLVGSLSNAALTAQGEIYTEYLTQHIAPQLQEMEGAEGLCEESVQKLFCSSTN